METTDKQAPKKDKSSKYAKFLQYLQGIQEEKFTGYIKINFSQGQIGRVEKFEEILKS
ncbi:MAG: hypothetical protein ACOZF0_17530 [Thermodesulfobacteriota bacterium]